MKNLKLEEPLSSEVEVLDLSRKHPISDEVVTEILSKLPVKSVLRFKSVEKSWRALICSREFINCHTCSSANNNKDCTGYNAILKIAQPEVNLQECPVMEESDLDYHMENSGIAFSIEGSVKGLFCLVNAAKELVLWNPAMRKYKKLPDFRTEWRDANHFTYGFGYDEINDDYKVVRTYEAGAYTISEGRVFHQEVNIYSQKNDSWQITDRPQKLHGERLINSGKFVNGKLHWVSTVGLGSERVWSITSFDLANEEWRKVERPCGDGVLVLGVLGSNLSMICNNPTTHIDVWVMKEYDDNESWMKMFTINYTLNPAEYFLSQSFGLSKRGEFVLMFKSTYLIYNPKDNSVRYSQLRKFDYGILTDFYIQSLVCPLSQNEPRTQQD